LQVVGKVKVRAVYNILPAHRLEGVMEGKQGIFVRDVAVYMIINQQAEELRQG
jgi:hypothetical protein